jgi:hypothetical protein
LQKRDWAVEEVIKDAHHNRRGYLKREKKASRLDANIMGNGESNEMEMDQEPTSEDNNQGPDSNRNQTYDKKMDLCDDSDEKNDDNKATSGDPRGFTRRLLGKNGSKERIIRHHSLAHFNHFKYKDPKQYRKISEGNQSLTSHHNGKRLRSRKFCCLTPPRKWLMLWLFIDITGKYITRF